MKRNLLLAVVCVLMLSACAPKATNWEYKTIKVAGQECERSEEFQKLTFEDQTSMLNKMGEDRWELVSAYTETETVHPNFGNSEYVTGIRENTRTCNVVFVFKRPKIEEK